MLDSERCVPGRGVQWVLIGDRGAKKHYSAHFYGSLVRQELNSRSSLYKQIANAVNEGKLVPDEVIFASLSKRLEEGYYCGENGFILDGIPRTRTQETTTRAEIVDQIADIDLVVNFKCTNELGTANFSACREYLSMAVQSAPGETWQGLLAALHLQHINAVNSSQKLTA
ncbi:adenylate kinase 1 [Pyrus ussuriensis x Pyrus communis]|uniref:adenylate kinase n=1 Tax=Pyrus ussuriensis x Pyrus communis TaxID=2448454 RepID=A0A5N5F2A0_9ROSA|nr:adenylate kinase 1 [Pyrus ussuriensis x Pyrus communis]